MAPSRSIWRGPKAQHFTLVHRSQQDPLLHDAEASNRVLKSTPKRQEAAAAAAAAGQSRAELEQELGAVAQKERKNVGEAAQYGIYLDDTEYDYMQHLRPMGTGRPGAEAAEEADVILLEAPKPKTSKGKQRAGNDYPIDFKDGDNEKSLTLPPEALPSKDLLPRTFEQDKEGGLRPDLNPHLRQVLEALDDDAFLMSIARNGARAETQVGELVGDDGKEEEDEEDLDDFFGEIVKEGELESDNDEAADWRDMPPEGEEGIYLNASARAARELLQLKEEGKGVEDLSLQSRVALFKEANAERQTERVGKSRAPSSVGSKSIFGEKGPTHKSRHPGAKARHAASFYAPSIEGGATAFSMSSSAMERNAGLTNLDDQFARLERIYEEEQADSDEEAEEEGKGTGGPERFDAIFDDFLARNEIIGNRMRERLGDLDTTAAEKVDMIRKELGELRMIDRHTLDEAEAAGLDPRETVAEMIVKDLRKRKEARNRWDVETIQTTKTNLENHPTTIAASQSIAPSRISAMPNNGLAGSITGDKDRMARVKIDPRTGKATVMGHINIGERQARRQGRTEPALKVDEAGDTGEADSSDAESFGSQDTTTIASIAAHGGVIKRDRNESKEAKQQRKFAVKEEKRARKEQKAQRKEAFRQAVSSNMAADNRNATNAVRQAALPLR